MDAYRDQPLDIAVIAPSRFPISEPYAGGLEVVVAKEVRALRERGHRVSLFAAAGSDGHVRSVEFTVMAAASGSGDISSPPGGVEADAAEFHLVMDHLAVSGVDVVLNHSLSNVPLERAADLDAVMITTMHCPRVDPMQDALDRHGAAAGRVMAVSRSVLGAWRVPQGADVVLNGVETRIWRPRPLPERPPRAVWCGRIVPEKAPHLAIDAALAAGLTLDLAGRIGDPDYMSTVVAPRLRDAGDAVRFHGALGRDALVPLVAGASVALVTPCWEEPFGLTAVEALACGTPVVALARGGIREILSGQPGVILVEAGRGPGPGVAAAIPAALTLDRVATARAAAAAFSHEARIDRLEGHLRDLLVGAAS